jgi:sodium transport system permease protein
VREILIIAQKEFLHCCRGRNVLLFFIFPPAFLALTLLGGAAVPALLEGANEHHQFKIVLARDDKSKFAMALRAILSKDKRMLLVESLDCARDISTGKADAAARTDKSHESGEVLYNSCYFHSVAANTKLHELLDQQRLEQIHTALKARGLPENAVKLFEIKKHFSNQLMLGPSKNPNASHLVPDLLWASLIIGIAFAGAGTLYPAVSMLAEEREKRTLETTMLLPVSRHQLIAGKLLATSSIPALLTVLNSAYFVILGLIVCSQFKLIAIGESLQVLKTVLSPATTLVIVAVILISSIFCAAVFVLFTAFSQSLNEAENLAVLPFMICELVPITGALPTLNLDSTTALIPLVNSTLCLKAAIVGQTFTPLMVVSAAEMLLIVAAIILIIDRLLKSEDFFFGGGSQSGLLSLLWSRKHS